MAAELKSGVTDITKCSICSQTFTKPKILPCIHTFCLRCLENCARNVQSNEFLPCPLCKWNFHIPVGGVTNLKNNIFIEKLVETRNASSAGVPVFSCDLCEDGKDMAQWHCLECKQNLCEPCEKNHRRQKLTVSHKLVEIDKQDPDELLKCKPSFCGQHPDKRIELYCTDCKNVICMLCFVEEHQSHNCQDVLKSSEQFRRQIRQESHRIEEQMKKHREEVRSLECRALNFDTRCSEIETQIAKRSEELKRVVEQNADKLHQELRGFKQDVLNNIKLNKEILQGQILVMESFKIYSKEVLDKATPVDLSRVADDLQIRAVELCAIKAISIPPVIIEFLATPSAKQDFLQERTRNVVGEVFLKEEVKCEKAKEDVIRNETFCTKVAENWSCPMCTFQNKQTNEACEMCGFDESNVRDYIQPSIPKSALSSPAEQQFRHPLNSRKQIQQAKEQPAINQMAQIRCQNLMRMKSRPKSQTGGQCEENSSVRNFPSIATMVVSPEAFSKFGDPQKLWPRFDEYPQKVQAKCSGKYPEQDNHQDGWYNDDVHKSSGYWNCGKCTYTNKLNAIACQMCGARH